MNPKPELDNSMDQLGLIEGNISVVMEHVLDYKSALEALRCA